MNTKIVVFLLIISVFISGCTIKPKTENLESIYAVNKIPYEDKIQSLSELWSYAKSYYGYWELLDGTSEWDKKYSESLTKLKETTSDYEYQQIMLEFGALLQDGRHFGISWPNQVQEYCLPMTFLAIDKKYYINSTSKNFESLPLFSELVKIDNMDIETYTDKYIAKFITTKTPGAYENNIATLLNKGKQGQEHLYTFKTPEGNEKELPLKFELESDMFLNKIEIEHFKNCPSYKVIRMGNYYAAYLLDNSIAYIIIDSLSDSSISNAIISVLQNELSEAKYYILDIRNNEGGSSQVAAGILSFFMEGEILQIKLKAKISNSYTAASASMNQGISSFSESELKGKEMLENQYYEVITNDLKDAKVTLLKNNVVLLIGNNTVSAGEDMALFAQNAGITLIGDNTMGASGQIGVYPLKDGGNVRFSSARVLTKDGKDIWNQGVQPDIVIKQSYKDYIEGTDAVLEYALNMARENYEK